jgi:hypothetical protein
MPVTFVDSPFAFRSDIRQEEAVHRLCKVRRAHGRKAGSSPLEAVRNDIGFGVGRSGSPFRMTK